MDDLETKYKVKRFSRYKSQIGLVIMTASIFVLFMITSPEVFLRGRIYQSFLSTVPFPTSSGSLCKLVITFSIVNL